MRKWDYLLIIILLAAAGVIWLFYSHGTVKNADQVCARVDGKEIGRWSLYVDDEIDIDTEFGHNLLKIEKGTAVMVEADCPDGYCTEQKKIGEKGGSIICLPHHLVVEASGSKEDTSGFEVDTIAQ